MSQLEQALATRATLLKDLAVFENNPTLTHKSLWQGYLSINSLMQLSLYNRLTTKTRQHEHVQREEMPSSGTEMGDGSFK